MINLLKNKDGIITMITVIIISAVALFVGLTVALTGIDEAQIGGIQVSAYEVFTGADGCMDEALYDLNSDRTGYTGEVLVLGDVNCTIAVTGSGSTRTINVTATMDAGRYTREIEADVSWITAVFKITEYREITN